MNFSVPINPVSFGQVSTLILKELYDRNLDINIFPIGNSIDLSTQDDNDKKFVEWLRSSAVNSLAKFSRKDKNFKLWHINGSHESISAEPNLFTFYELDSPTKEELNIVKNHKKVFFSSNFSVDIFKQGGCNNVSFIPLAFDKNNFKKIDKTYFKDDRITFNLCGKLEKRKHHEKIIKTWIRKYGNDSRYNLQCAIYNPFFDQETNSNLINSILDNKKVFNISFLGFMQKNSIYNDYLNSSDIIIGLSGGEGWGLPEFHSVGLGKYGIILNAHAYKDWATKDNSILVEPNGKISAEDNVFFKKGTSFNQGNIYDFEADDFISACEIAIEKVSNERINKNGLELQEKFNIKNMVDKIISEL